MTCTMKELSKQLNQMENRIGALNNQLKAQTCTIQSLISFYKNMRAELDETVERGNKSTNQQIHFADNHPFFQPFENSVSQNLRSGNYF